MRISDKMIFDSSVIRNNNHRSRMEKAMAETSTGRRVVHPWDDPVAAGRWASPRFGTARPAYRATVRCTARKRPHA